MLGKTSEQSLTLEWGYPSFLLPLLCFHVSWCIEDSDLGETTQRQRHQITWNGPGGLRILNIMDIGRRDEISFAVGQKLTNFPSRRACLPFRGGNHFVQIHKTRAIVNG